MYMCITKEVLKKGINMIKTIFSKDILKKQLILFITVLFGFSSFLYCQDFGFEDMTRSKLWVRISNHSGVGDRHGSGEAFRYDYPGFKKGADLYNSYGHVEWAGFMTWAEVDGVGIPFRHNNAYSPDTEKIQALQNATLVKNYNLVDPSIPAEEVFTGAVRLLKYGVDLNFRALGWSYPGYDAFLIQEYTFKNTGSHEITNFRFAPTAAMAINTGGGGWWDDDGYYEWDKDHKAFYFHDGETFDPQSGEFVVWDYGLTQSDKGDPTDLGAPNSITHDFRSPGYFTYYWLDKPEQSDPANPEHDHMNIVDKINMLQTWSRVQVDPTNANPEIGTVTDAFFYQSMLYDQPPPLTYEDGAAISAADAFATPRARGKFEYAPDYLYSTGPYDMSPGEELKFVMVVAAGMMDFARVEEGGVANEAHLIDGRDNLWANVDQAIKLYDNNYVLPHPPSTPNYAGMQGPNSILVSPAAGGIKIQWDENPASEDVAGYKVYKATFRSVGPWTLAENISAGEIGNFMENGLVTFLDTDARLGVGYYYVVTAYDSGQLECGQVNGNHEPVYPRAATSDNLNDVRIYPNPYKQESGLLGEGEGNRIEFVNIPAECTIRIYTLAGDLVRKIEHDDGSGDEAWGSRALGDYQVSKYLQHVAPGIYLVHVESHVEGHEGEEKVAKFVIIK